MYTHVFIICYLVRFVNLALCPVLSTVPVACCSLNCPPFFKLLLEAELELEYGGYSIS